MRPTIDVLPRIQGAATNKGCPMSGVTVIHGS
jgi:hypothetical protein